MPVYVRYRHWYLSFKLKSRNEFFIDLAEAACNSLNREEVYLYIPFYFRCLRTFGALVDVCAVVVIGVEVSSKVLLEHNIPAFFALYPPKVQAFVFYSRLPGFPFSLVSRHW